VNLGRQLEFVDGGEESVIVVAHPAAIGDEEWPDETATVITLREGKVVDLPGPPDERTRWPASANHPPSAP